MKLKIFLAAAAVCLLTGCGAVQVSDRMYVQMMGLSEEEGECVLCVQAVGTKSPADEAPVYEYYEGRGRSFRQAAADIEAERGRQLFFGHCTLLVLDGKYLSSAEALKMLMGEKISPGCRVCCSDMPGAVLSREGENGLIGADVISGETDRLADRGLFMEVTLKEVCVTAARGEAFLLPAARSEGFVGGDNGGTSGSGGGGDPSGNGGKVPGDMSGGKNGNGDSGENGNSDGGASGGDEAAREGEISVRGGMISGSGAVYGGEIRFLDMDETVIAGLLRGEAGAELPVSGGTLRVDSSDPAIYCQTGENILNVSLDIRGTMTEISDNTDLEQCRLEAEEMLSKRVRLLLGRNDSGSVVTAVVGAPEGETVNAEVRITIEH